VVEVDGKVEAIVAETLQMPAGQVSDALTMEDAAAWDSLKHMELIVALEGAFGVELSFDEIVTMRSVGEIKSILREKAAA
jgi:acyl carrier protein